jgi:CRP/FNR family transcriptional regulator
MNLTQHQRGEYLFHVGDRAESIFLLFSGLVKKSFVNPGGDEKIVSLHVPGDIFGELFLGKYPLRVATAQALEETLVGRLTRDHLTALISHMPQIGMNLIGHLADEQRETLARLHALMHIDARHRLLGTLLSLARRICCTSDNWVQLPASITQDDIASIACVNRSTANVQINHWRAQGILGGKGRVLLINRLAVAELLNDAGLEILE